MEPSAETYCTFDTRAFVKLRPDARVIESITAYGHFWNFDAITGGLIDSGLLASVANYKRGAESIFADGFD
ncbi:MAG: hypothetical protein ABIR62_07320 [Dokdonella sp.]|uniref:hypothetical protein n=1 Tax=Dokdonella sp. TaxID=2291710 RepID=UPI0032665476